MSRPPGEFDLIARFFTRPQRSDRVELGIGDDCALIDGGPDRSWAVTTDMLVEGVHFLSETTPEALGHKALAVNLSDLAACGAQPRCFFMAIALPRVDEAWLGAFTGGLFALGDRFGCTLAGGDTTRSVAGVTISIAAVGEVPPGQALLRSGAQTGDDVWVSGRIGDGAGRFAQDRLAKLGDLTQDGHGALTSLQGFQPETGISPRARMRQWQRAGQEAAP